ncbi:hypothetical protein K469DRAFT_735382 [Zopfia rhizophila CBS 207.26]|uniref:RBR-type E3 ubiquitin transferase n=1 Tax=Zopfia rhizophila CBS 207.26 TaxID=1314779 RepID=A0A6A6EMP6_9PEZI|nr:hypothetical protein K469DRAFT_735382 [Zopfia rhizophila CBS 207.26]
MGQSLTRLPDLPGPEVKTKRSSRVTQRRIRHGSPAKAKVDSAEAPRTKTTLHASSHHDTSRTDGKDWRRNALAKTDGNSRRTATESWTRDQTRRNHKAQERREDGVSVASRHSHHHKNRTSRSHKDHSNVSSSKNSRQKLLRDKRNRQPKCQMTLHEPEITKLEDLSPKKDCIVCAESRSLHRFPKRPPTASCVHEVNTCWHCLRGWIRSEFESKIWDQISCPECSTRMQYEDIREFAPSEVFRRYDRLSTKAALESIPGFRWCIAKGCRSGQVHDESTFAPKFRCISCHYEHCITHNRRWHKGETCAEYDYRTDRRLKKAEEEASNKLIREIAKKCPMCKWCIEKYYGCDHMTCSKCRHEFCWVCLAPYGPIRNQGNRMHRPTCTHYG